MPPLVVSLSRSSNGRVEKTLAREWCGLIAVSDSITLAYFLLMPARTGDFFVLNVYVDDDSMQLPVINIP